MNLVDWIMLISAVVVLIAIAFGPIPEAQRSLPLGVAIGVFATFYGMRMEIWGGRREAKERRDRTRKVLSLEIEQNLDEVSAFWQKVLAEISKKEKPAKGREMKAYRLAIIPLPTFTHIMWESQAAYLPQTLEPDEFGSANRLHALLYSLTTIHRYLEQQRPDAEGQPKGPEKTERNPWEKYSPGQWDAFERAVCKVKKLGNPLASH